LASFNGDSLMSRVVVTGGAGFVGSHLCEALLARGDQVVCIDNLSTSDGSNLAFLEASPGFTFVEGDVSAGMPVEVPVDVVVHLASPASPPDYLRLPLETLAVGSRGTEACLDLAKRANSRLLFASTSEIYGDPQVHPQPEAYWGNVSSTGPRSVYDEAKRFGEALTMAYSRYESVNAGIVRIFNTYGPRLRRGDGRVVSNFVHQALSGVPLTIYGDGLQTRSFCYVDDLVTGLLAMIDQRDFVGPVNIGNPQEITVAELARRVLDKTGSTSEVVYSPAPEQDPARRQPDITLARERLGWSPAVSLEDGLERTVNWFRRQTSRL
jgi:dTDP-glucose 4,6-dehydratase